MLQKTATSGSYTPPARTNLLQRKCSCNVNPGTHKEYTECHLKPLTVQPSTSKRGGHSAVLQVVNEVLNAPGQPLDSLTRASMESRFGHDFSRVRVHANAKAAESTQALSAQAYTVGHDIVFGAAMYAPETREGERLMIHELTHVMQQGDATYHPADRLTISPSNDPAEQQANQVSDALIKGHPVTIAQHLATRIARQELNSETVPTPAGTAPSTRPVFFCSKPIALGQRHAFFRVGGAAPGNPTFGLEHDEHGDHCRCGIQGWPTRDYPEDRDATNATCIPAPTITETCLVNNWLNYPIGKYCALGPNSNTYTRVLAENCGARGLRPPGSVPGFDDAPPPSHTANPALDARITFLPGACQTIDCDDRICDEIYF